MSYDCPLCRAEAEERYMYKDERVKVLSTKTLKGHANRPMVITRKHVAHVSPWMEQHMMDRLEEVSRLLFGNDYKFVIMSPVNGTVEDHAHFVATDLNPGAEDFGQVLGTPWLRVVDVKRWEK